MADDAAQRRAEAAQRAQFHVEALRRCEDEEAARAQVMVDRFVERAKQAGLPTEELTARPWSGSGRYKTGVVGWFLRRNGSVGVDTDGRFYVLNVPPVTLGRWRKVTIEPSPPPLIVGRGGGDGETFALDELLEMRLRW
jgi:hypothetical protein